MLIDRPQIPEGSIIVNPTVPSGVSEPANPSVGELFFRTDLGALRTYGGATWAEAGSVALNSHISDQVLHLTSGQNAWIDAITATSAEINFLSGTATNINARLVAIEGVNTTQNTNITNLQSQANGSTSGLSTHMADATVHLTSAQNTLLDNLSASLTAAELNFSVGVTSSLQTQLNTLSTNKYDKAGGTISGNVTINGTLSMNNTRIMSVGAPTSATDAATKDYVDTLVQGLAWKDSARVATTVNIALTGLQTIDGVAVTSGERVVVKNQTITSQNGVYLASSGAWSRAPDANTPTELDGLAVFVRDGTVHKDTAWVQTNPIVTVDTTAVVFSQFAAAGGATEGNGISIAGSTISTRIGNGLSFSANTMVVNPTTRFTFTGSQLDLANTGVTSGTYGDTANIPSITVDQYGRVTAASNNPVSVQGANANLSAIASLSGTGFTAFTATGSAALRTLTPAANGFSSAHFTIINPQGIAGNPTFNLAAFSTNIASSLVARDVSGNFSAGTITASFSGPLTGNASTATALATARNFSITGGATASAISFDGSGAVALNVTAVDATALTGSIAGARLAGTYSIDISGNANTATSAGNAATVSSVFVGSASGQDLNVITTAGFYRVNTTEANRPSDYGQLLVMHGAADTITQLYGDYSTGNLFTRSGNPASVGGAGVLGAWHTLLSSSNFNSYAPTLTGVGASGNWNINAATATSAGNADTVDGLHVHGGVNNEPSKIVRTDVNGYIHAGWINTISGDNGTTAFDRIYASNDSYLRYYTPTNFTAQIQSYASGNWNINAATATSATSAGAVAWANVSGRPTALSAFTNDGVFITTDGRAYPRRSDGAGINFNWSGQGGQPTWLWGGEDGISMYVYNPANFSVNYATSAGTATNSSQLGGVGAAGYALLTGATFSGDITAYRSVAPTTGVIYLGNTGTKYLYFDGTNYAMPGGNLTVNGAVVITTATVAGAVTSYAPGQDGTNAYGTWAIDITGNSATTSQRSFANVRTDGINRGSYGSISIANNNTGWSGIDFTDSNMTLMMQSGGGISGVYKNNDAWVWGFDTNGVMTYGSVPWTSVTGAPSFVKADGTVAMTGSLTINNATPTITMQDTDNLSAFLHVNGNALYFLRGAGVNAASWDSGPNGRHPMTLSLTSGDVVFSGNVTAYSDLRLKKDVKPIIYALDKVEQLQGVTYSRLESDTRQTGLIAQDVQAVLPEAVVEQEDGMLTVAYGNMMGLMVEAIKELNRELAAVKAELAQLKNGTTQ